MYNYRIRIRNRLLQAFYRPKGAKSQMFSRQTLSVLDEIDKKIEETITPIFKDLFKDF